MSISEQIFTDAEKIYFDILKASRIKGDLMPALEAGHQDNYLKLKARKFPWSLKHKEFDFARSLIASFQLKRGFEVATGFGLSTLALALGLDQTDGSLVSMDAYIEERFDDWISYDGHRHLGNESALGFRSADFLLNQFGVRSRVDLKIGWSPDDTASTVRGFHGENRLDFAFIDGLHTEAAVVADIEAVLPLMADRFVLLLHDSGGFGPYVDGFFRGKFGRRWIQPRELAPPQGFDLAYFSVGYDVDPWVERFERGYWSARTDGSDPASRTPGQASLVGAWRWFSGARVDVTLDGTVFFNDQAAGYACDVGGGHHVIVWRGGEFIDHVKLDDAAMSLAGLSDKHARVTAERIQVSSESELPR